MDLGEKKILVVDDAEDNRLLMQVALETFGYEIDTASSVTEGIEKIEDQVPDLVLVDFMMPDALGSELVSYIRQNDTIAQTPIIMVTAYVALARERGELGDVNVVLHKPLDIDLLREQVDQLLLESGQDH